MSLRSLLRATGTACLVICAVSPSAYAAQRYAAADSSVTSGSCATSNPCTLTAAIMGAADGDSITVRPGNYTISAQIKPTVAVHIAGDPTLPMPNVVAIAPLAKDALDLGAGSSIRHMRLESTVPDKEPLDLKGALGENLILVISSAATGSAGHPPAAAHLVSSMPASVLRNSVAYATGAGSAAVVVTSSKTPQVGHTASIVNVSAVALGAGATGITSTQTPGNGTVEIRNSVARGTAYDISADVAGAMRIGSSNFVRQGGAAIIDLGGNGFGDPLFVGTAAGDLHVRSGSPLIDAGSAAVLSTGPDERDPDGRPRVLGGAPDIGAFEFAVSIGSGADAPGGADTPASLGGAGPDAPLAAGTGAPLTPQLGVSVVVRAASGVVKVRAANAAAVGVPSGGMRVTVGSVIDASRGKVDLTSVRDSRGALQTARFWGGSFVVTQSSTGDTLTKLRLTGGSRASCRARKAVARRSLAQVAATRRPIRRLWGRDKHGRFQTHGRDSVATVRGTSWLTEDRCDGTLTKVTSGAVLVRNRHTKRSVLVRAGKQYLARSASRR